MNLRLTVNHRFLSFLLFSGPFVAETVGFSSVFGSELKTTTDIVLSALKRRTTVSQQKKFLTGTLLVEQRLYIQ